ncbi:hypothetical protein ANCCEY_14981 [Ancylostoma ceylanicum]|uniref:Uncharacterized protein n=1 Tax=Ancylostoma ceylanicum TaxID=53326 RepID=A0A0D6L5L0_9BILA|nr:hypothetical protein ANCCEY_14981 [Ancylostoma ceylanicum]
MPFQGGWICHPVGSPLRSPTCHQVGEESYSARSRQDSTRTSEESTDSSCEHIYWTPHAIPSECKVPSQWKTSSTVLVYKKGDAQDIGNYRLIWLLSVDYKFFTRVLNRIERTLDKGQSCERAGFRKRFSTIDHTDRHQAYRSMTIVQDASLSHVHRFEESLKHRWDRSSLGSPGQPECTDSTQYVRI